MTDSRSAPHINIPNSDEFATRITLIRNDIFGLAVRYESSVLPLYSLFNRLLLLVQSTLIFVLCWRDETEPGRWRLFHHYFHPGYRQTLHQFLCDTLQGRNIPKEEDFLPATIACPGTPDSIGTAAPISPILLSPQDHYELLLVRFDAGTLDTHGDHPPYGSTFQLVQHHDREYQQIRQLFESLNNDPASKLIFGSHGERLRDAIHDFIYRHCGVEDHPYRRTPPPHEAPISIDNTKLDTQINALMRRIKDHVFEPLLIDVGSSPLVRFPPSLQHDHIESEGTRLPFSNLFFVIRIPYDDPQRMRCGALPYTLRYLIPEPQRDRIRKHYKKLARGETTCRFCDMTGPSKACTLGKTKDTPCILDITPGEYQGFKSNDWGDDRWHASVGAYERHYDEVERRSTLREEDRSIVDLIEHEFGDNFRSLVDTAISLGTIFFTPYFSVSGNEFMCEGDPKKDPARLSKDRLRYFSTLCVFHQLVDADPARMMIIPIQVAGTHYACTLTVYHNEEKANEATHSEPKWLLRTYLFYNMIMSRTVVRRIRKDLMRLYLDLIEASLITRYRRNKRTSPLGKREAHAYQQPASVDPDKVLTDTTRDIEIFSRRIPYPRIILSTNASAVGKHTVLFGRTAKERPVYMQFSMAYEDHFPRMRVSKKHTKDGMLLIAQPHYKAYIRDAVIRDALERAILKLRMDHPRGPIHE